MSPFQTREDHILVWQADGETVWIQPWAQDTLRVRAKQGSEPLDLPGALLEPTSTAAVIAIADDGATITNGKLQAFVSSQGHITFRRADTGAVLLDEAKPEFFRPPEREYLARSSDLFHIAVRFKAREGERFYGLGQHAHGHLDQKGCVLELIQRNNQVPIPVLVSSLGYGFIWHNPAIGRVELGYNGTQWVAEAARQIDYLVYAGDSYAELMRRYADLTGYPPMMPDWAAGFWQSKLRYRDQEELLNIAREYHQRGLPLEVIVIDFFHWTNQGDWRFAPEAWPDPAGMVRELESMGVKPLVSIWPTVSVYSENYAEMRRRGMLLRSERGLSLQKLFTDPGRQAPVSMAYYDPTHPEAGRFVWEQVREGYYRYGIKLWWLDSCEPEFEPMDHDNLRFYLGNGLEVASLYPLLHEKSFYEGMRAEGETEIIMLCRAGWLGSQRYAASIWSGDVDSTFESFREQVRAGLNMALSGIPWWNTDIGGFKGSDTSTDYFRELVVRWFQYGVFCPVCRLHGVRGSYEISDLRGTGSDNEVWSFGDRDYAILKDLLFLRKRLRPYIMEQMQVAHETGLPMMRPLFFEFEADDGCIPVDDQFMFGPEVLVAPVMYEGATERKVYLPAGTQWTDAWTGQIYDGGTWMLAEAPLERIPVYLRGVDNALRTVFTPDT